MCEYCHKFPHALGCPNDPDPDVVFECSACGADIREGEACCKAAGYVYCYECFRIESAEFDDAE